MTHDTQRDVIIIGGGPAGSTAATLLAQAGVDVLVLEKERFPRFHIGESLLPCDLPIFARLGVSLEGQPYLYKGGAEFIDERTGDYAEYLFRDGLAGTPPHAYQVERAQFDHLLLERSKAVGAVVNDGVRVTDVVPDDDGVTVTTAEGTHRARYAIDATGQDAFLARKLHGTVPLRDFGIAAVFCHFDGLHAEAERELSATGNIRVLIIEDGWMWLIPLHGGRLSVGVVTRRTGVTASLLDEMIAASPLITRLTAGGHRTPGRVIRNFSYRNAKSRGARWACIGDASLFLDPVFSSGVSLAMFAGERLADALIPALRERREADPALADGLAREMEKAYVSFSSLVGSFYHKGIVQNLFFARRPDPETRAGLISVLAGDVWRDDNKFQNALLASGRRRFDPFAVSEPEERPEGSGAPSS